ncbi:MAG: hypothetical protein U0132_01290 [Gemmatimonadaceae bacterium]
MHRWFVSAVVALGVLAPSGVAQGQTAGWNDARTTALVQRATELRQRQLADTGLANYTAMAHGYLTFLAQVGEGFPDPPKVVKADELALEVYWRAPNYSKQWIVGRRDTLLLPTDINYHRDHLGIVQNNFANIIRLGDGDEVRDVPHPMSATGLATYDYRIADSLSFQLPGRSIDVYEIKVRPKDDRVAAAVGAVYVSREDAQIVRMTFSFTRAALLDKYLEDVSIVLDNALQEARFWLPRRQEIEIRRTGTWMDFPARGIIRGRWEIGSYQVNGALPPEVNAPGPEIVLAPPARRRGFEWKGRLLDSLPPDVRAATDVDVVRIQAEARDLVRAGALARAQSTSISAHRVSDMVRITRAEGLALGAGVKQRLRHGLSFDVAGRFGLSDHEPKGSTSLTWERPRLSWQLAVVRDYADARDFPEASSLVNSLAAQEFGTDYTEPYDTRAVRLSVGGGARALRWGVGVERRRVRPVEVVMVPEHGHFAPTIPVQTADETRLFSTLNWPSMAFMGGSVLRGTVTASGSSIAPLGTDVDVTVGRISAEIVVEKEFTRSKLLLRSAGGAVWGTDSVPANQLLYAGGPVSAPGYGASRFAAKRLFSGRAEWQFGVPAPSLSLGRWGRVPGSATLAPYVSVLVAQGGAPFRRGVSGAYPSVGLGVLPFFGLVRLDISRSLREPKWGFSVDVTRDFWRIL